MDANKKRRPAPGMTRAEAASFLGVCTRTLRNWERTGGLQRIQIARPGVWYAVADIRGLAGLPPVDVGGGDE